MPSDQSTWLVAVPHDGDAESLHQELVTKLQVGSKSAVAGLASLPVPKFKVSAPVSVCAPPLNLSAS